MKATRAYLVASVAAFQQAVLVPRSQSAVRAGRSSVMEKIHVDKAILEKQDEGVAEMLATAQQLREEAASLEAELTAESKSDLDDFFLMADADKDGQVTADELRATLWTRLVEQNANAQDAARAAKLLSGARVENVIKELDRDSDDMLDRTDWVSEGEFRNRLERLFRERPQHDSTHRAVLKTRKVKRRIELFEERANATDALILSCAAICYALPALEVASYGIVNVPLVSPLLVSASTVYQNIPFSGLGLIFLLLNLAWEYKCPRHVRFHARHAVILDLVGAFLVPPAMSLLKEPSNFYLATAFEFLVFTCAAFAFAGRDTAWVPVTGQIANSFTTDLDTQVKDLIETAVWTEDDDFNTNTTDLSSTDDIADPPEARTTFDRFLNKFYKDAGIDPDYWNKKKKDEAADDSED